MQTISLYAALLIAASPSLAPAQSAETILDRAVAAYNRLNSMRVEFRQTLTNPLTGSAQTVSGVILRKKPNLLNISFTSGDRVAADGSTLWVYLPSSVPGQVIRMPYTGSNATAVDPADQFLNSPHARFTVTSAGTATVAGRPTHGILLVPKRDNPHFANAKIWIDDSDYTIRQFDVETANGLKRHVVVSAFTPNPPIARSAFHFSVPRGAKIVDQSGLAGVEY